MKVMENYQKHLFSNSFKKIWALHSTPLSLYRKLTPPQVFPLFAPRVFKIAMRASVVESLFNKVTETRAFCKSVEKYNTYMVFSEK